MTALSGLFVPRSILSFPHRPSTLILKLPICKRSSQPCPSSEHLALMHECLVLLQHAALDPTHCRQGALTQARLGSIWAGSRQSALRFETRQCRSPSDTLYGGAVCVLSQHLHFRCLMQILRPTLREARDTSRYRCGWGFGK